MLRGGLGAIIKQGSQGVYPGRSRDEFLAQLASTFQPQHRPISKTGKGKRRRDNAGQGAKKLLPEKRGIIQKGSGVSLPNLFWVYIFSCLRNGSCVFFIGEKGQFGSSEEIRFPFSILKWAFAAQTIKYEQFLNAMY